MVARRFREFSAVDANLRAAFPDLAPHLPTLPSSWTLFAMAPEVVEQRKRGLENYLRKVVAETPQLLRSTQVDEFLCISDRIKAMQDAGRAD